MTLAPGENMLGDAFVRAGTVQNPKGAVGFFGTTFVGSHISYPRGLVTTGFFRALYLDSIFTMGGAAKRAKFIMDSISPNQTRYLEWNLLGDPELNVWTRKPRILAVTHSQVIPLQPTTFPVLVQCNGQPVTNALVCVMMDSTVYTYGYTDTTGYVILTFTPQHTGTLDVTVTAHNYFPYEGTAEVIFHDVGITEIVNPHGIIDSTDSIIPQVRVKNYGATIESFNITFKIGTTYNQTRVKTLDAGVEDTVNFPAWVPVRGTYITRCSTHLADNNPTNDTLSDIVTVQIQDVGVMQIITPSGTITSGAVVIPEVRLTNLGTDNQTFPAYFRILSATDTIYYDDTTVTIGANQNLVVRFASWNSVSGLYRAIARTALIGDLNSINDTISTNFIVAEAGWQRLADVPTGPSGEALKNGSCLTALAGKIYLLKANNTSDFYCFTPNSTTGNWTTLTGIPLGSKETGDGKNPKKGAAITADDSAVYVLRGNNTCGFWRYITTGPGWQKLKDIPTGAKNPRDGSGLTYVNKNGENCIFAMKGAKTQEFYLYFINSNNWQQVASPGIGTSGKMGYSKGSCLTYDGDSFVYVLKGNYGDFFRYNILNNNWTELRRLDPKIFLNRDNKKKKVKDGAGLVYLAGSIYLMKGGNTNEFWKYDIANNTWSQMNPAEIWDIPIGGGKKVKSGGGLCVLDNFFYAVKGNKTTEFYRHGPPVINPLATSTNLNNTFDTMENKISVDNATLSIIPNPTSNIVRVKYNLPFNRTASIKLYNVSGELVESYANCDKTKTLLIDVRQLPAGVYVLELDSNKKKITKKLIVAK
jgi:hypothetical protein